MSHTPNELAQEFPQAIAQMHDLNASDAHFAKLSSDYHELNRAVHRAETDVEPTSDDHLTDMRKQRLALKDQIAAYLNNP
ncbi:MAG: hypothetical protein ACJAXK_000161 [Yoonia sp.]|jgi:uncharacterized protein YdcH (DUF465 family)